MSKHSNIIKPVNRPARYPYTVNRQSSQARGLKAWFPFAAGLRGMAGYVRTLTPATGTLIDYAAIPQIAPFLGIGYGPALYYTCSDVTGIASNVPATLSCWVRPLNIAASVIMALGDTAGWNDTTYVDLTGAGKVRCVQVTNGFAAFGLAESTTVLSDSRWYLVTGVIPNNTSAEIYVNGRLEHAATFSTVASGAPEMLRLGADFAGANAFIGQVADVRVYDRALSASEVWGLYDPATRHELKQPLARQAYFFAPPDTGDQTVEPGFVDSVSTVYAPTVVPGELVVSPGFIDSTSVVYQPSVDGDQAVSPGFISSTAVVYAPTVVPGALTVSPGFISSTSTVYAPSVVGATVAPASRTYTVPATPTRPPAFPVYFQYADDVLDYSIDWTTFLGADDAITSSVWFVASGMEQEGVASEAEGVTTIWLTGGSRTHSYVVTNRIETEDGRTRDQVMKFIIMGHPASSEGGSTGESIDGGTP